MSKGRGKLTSNLSNNLNNSDDKKEKLSLLDMGDNELEKYRKQLQNKRLEKFGEARKDTDYGRPVLSRQNRDKGKSNKITYNPTLGLVRLNGKYSRNIAPEEKVNQTHNKELMSIGNDEKLVQELKKEHQDNLVNDINDRFLKLTGRKVSSIGSMSGSKYTQVSFLFL